MKDPKIAKEFLYYRELGMSVSQISRRLSSDRRTVRKYIDNPSLIGQPRKRSERGSKLDSYKQKINDLLDLDITFMASTIHRIISKEGYMGSYDLVKLYVRQAKKERMNSGNS